MTTAAELSIADRLAQVLDHLGIERAHFAASMLADITGFAQAHPERIASLTLVCPPRLDPSSLRVLATRLVVISGDQGRPAAVVRDAVTSLPEATVIWLSGYFSPPWADPVADCTADIETALLNILSRDQPQKDREVRDNIQGRVASITYRSEGAGTPLILLPLSLASSQWEPLLSRLSTRCQTVTMGGPELGFLAMLESRGRSGGYLSVVRRIMDVVQLRPGEVVLEVGCGSGVLDRWLARYTQANGIIGIDVNRYLLREATALARQEGLADLIQFQQGDAEALPFPDNHVDVALSFTVLEEGNADRMLAELVRVTKPGGRVAVMVRAIDIPLVVNVPLRPELKTKAQTPRGFVGAEGCADASLYRRFHQAGLSHTQMWPQFAASDQPETPQAQFAHGAILGALTTEEAQEWHAGVAEAVADGTYFIAQPFHCAVGIKTETA